MSVESGWEKVLPFFSDDLQALILDPTISDLMVNGTTGCLCRPGRRHRAYSASGRVQQ